MGVTKCVDKLTALQTANLSQHAGHEGIACDIEWHSKAEIARALVHLAGQLVVSRDVELGQDMARR